MGLLAPTICNAVIHLASGFTVYCSIRVSTRAQEVTSVYPSNFGSILHTTRQPPSRLHSSAVSLPGVRPHQVPRIHHLDEDRELPLGAHVKIIHDLDHVNHRHHLYFRASLTPHPILTTNPAHGHAIKFRMLRMSGMPSFFRLLVSRVLIRGTATLGYDIVSHPAGDLLPSESDLSGKCEIRIPTPLQMLKDVASSLFEDDSLGLRGPVETLPDIPTLQADNHLCPSEAMDLVNVDVVELPKKVEAFEIVDNKPSREAWGSDLHVVSVPVLRRFHFEGIPSASVHLDLNDVKQLPLSQLTHVTLKDVQISFNDCLKLVSQCPQLRSLCLYGRIGEGDSTPGLFGEMVRSDEYVVTRMRRLEIHGCAVEVKPLFNQLDFRQLEGLVLNLASRGIEQMTAASLDFLPLETLKELRFPKTSMAHPNVLAIVQRLGLSRIVRSV
ncbi:hypothetical protein Moror_11616 [Moniliophthora roreri MCA 2997]|uniref:F-box domain-containing protein n=2 Tax=Moniliophthora roreri TaxID=221103 RepID=V2X3S6_MONRO|nr:hypothetical protein Moror_11616 [Moniliophthora roreri MCA 2997]